MSIKKPNTQRKHEKIFSEIEILLHNKRVGSVLEACAIVAKKVKMTPPSVSTAYYNLRKEKSTRNHQLSNN